MNLAGGDHRAGRLAGGRAARRLHRDGEHRLGLELRHDLRRRSDMVAGASDGNTPSATGFAPGAINQSSVERSAAMLGLTAGVTIICARCRSTVAVQCAVPSSRGDGRDQVGRRRGDRRGRLLQRAQVHREQRDHGNAGADPDPAPQHQVVPPARASRRGARRRGRIQPAEVALDALPDPRRRCHGRHRLGQRREPPFPAQQRVAQARGSRSTLASSARRSSASSTPSTYSAQRRSGSSSGGVVIARGSS